MNVFELVVLGFALSMDSFSAAVCKGIEIDCLNMRKMLKVATWFAIFQALMPILGFFMANVFKGFLTNVDHWLSFFVLIYLGVSMIRDAKDSEKRQNGLGLKAMLFLSIAISIDAFTVGITYSLMGVNILLSSVITFTITFLTTIIGTKIGNIFGKILNEKAMVFGGLVLISMGIKIIIKHFNLF